MILLPYRRLCRLTIMSEQTSGEKQLTFFFWMTSLSLMTGALKVQLKPNSVLKHVNESLELVCSALGCMDKPMFMWKGLTDTTTGGKMESDQTTSRRVFNQLTTEDEQTIICRVKCGEYAESKARIKVFSFPHGPVLSRLNHTTLMCTVGTVFPIGKFKLDWLREETLLSSWEVPTVDGKGVQDIRSLYTPSEKDLGKDITCRVSLSLDELPKDQKVRLVTAQYGPAFITTSNTTTVKIGERLELRCDTDGKSNITWRKLGKSEAIPLITNITNVIVIKNATLSHAGEYECEASTELASRRSIVVVIVKGPPNKPKIRLSQSGNPRAGDNVTIICESDSASKLTISGVSFNQVEKQSSLLSVNLPSIQFGDSGLYHCEAQNEFGLSNSTVNIRVQAPPRNSTVLVYPSAHVMEAQNVTIHCSTVSFPPANVTLRRESDGIEIPSPNGIFHLFNLQSEDKGTYMVNFTNELGYETLTIEISVKERQSIASILTKSLIPSVSSISLLTAAALLMRYLKKAKNKGTFVPSLDDALVL